MAGDYTRESLGLGKSKIRHYFGKFMGQNQLSRTLGRG